jgi:hypothetical protein
MAMILLVGAVFPLAALLLAAIGPPEPAAGEVTVDPAPEPATEHAMRHLAVEPFRPSFSYTVDENWPYRFGIVPELHQIWREDESMLSFHAVREVHDPEEPSLEKAAPAPEGVEGMVRWLREHPYLSVGDSEPVTIGGMAGITFDVAISSVPEDYPPSKGCESPCVPLFRHADGSSFWIQDQTPTGVGIRHRVILTDVGGQTVTILVKGPIDGFVEFLPEAEEVLDSVEWRDLPTAEYATEQFQPPLSFRAAEDWPYRYGVAPDLYQISREDGATLRFLHPREVYDPKDLLRVAPAPKNVEGVVAWLRNHPFMDIGEPEQVTVGGADGVALDATVSNLPEDPADYASGYCEAPCLSLFRQRDQEPFVFYEGNRNRVVVLDVGGETRVVVTVGGPDVGFEETLAEAEEILNTVEWGK